MNFYLSYSTVFANSNNTFGWNKSKKNEVYDLTKLCLRYLRKNYKNVYLITDKKGEEIFADLDWSNITTELEGVISPKYKEVWSLGKLYAINTIANKNEPFLHIDYDFFILEKLPQDLLKAQILIQSREFGCDSHYEIWFYEKFCKNKYLKKYKRQTITYNCGILGGTDYKFFQKYSENAIKLVEDPKNEKFWKKKFLFPAFVKACIAEQYYLCCFLKEEKRRPTLLFNNKPANKFKMGLSDNYSPLDKKYFEQKKVIHLYGDNKIYFYKIYKDSKKEHININLSLIDKLIKKFQEKCLKESRSNFKRTSKQVEASLDKTLKIIKKFKNSLIQVEFADEIPKEYRKKFIKKISNETNKNIISTKENPFLLKDFNKNNSHEIIPTVFPANFIQEVTDNTPLIPEIKLNRKSKKISKKVLEKLIKNKKLEKSLIEKQIQKINLKK